MKTRFVFALVAALPVAGFAQATLPPRTNSLPAEPQLQKALPKPGEAADSFQASRTLIPVATGQVSQVTVDSAVVRAVRAGQPWQMINPFAPPEFWSDHDNVSRDPYTGQPTGVVFLSFRLGKAERGRR